MSSTAKRGSQWGYGYDAAGNLMSRTNNALVQTFSVNNRNELTGISRSGTLTVAGTTGARAGSVTVNGLSATAYSADTSFARAGMTLVDRTNTFTAIAQDYYLGSYRDTNTISVYLPASRTLTHDAVGNLLGDGRRREDQGTGHFSCGRSFRVHFQ